jgi:hypothetical protein
MGENSTQERNHLAKGTRRSGARAKIFWCFVLKAQPTQLQSHGFDLEESIYGDLFSKTTKMDVDFLFMVRGKMGENLMLSIMRSPP